MHRIVDELLKEGFLKEIRVRLKTGSEAIFVIRRDVRYYKKGRIDRNSNKFGNRVWTHLGLVPLWILRNAPATQFNQMRASGGFILKFKSQIYPLGFEDEVAEISKTMHLPVSV
jgi:hypothetical protein